MDLAVDFECPGCRKKIEQKLADLSPGRDRRCTECDVPTVLTERGLHDLQRRLEELYPSSFMRSQNP